MKGVCLHMGGGLGDILRVFLCGDVGYPWCEYHWGIIEKWRNDVGIKIKLLVSSHNPSAVEFFKYAPWVDELVEIPWQVDGTSINQDHADDFYKPFTLKMQKSLVALYRDQWTQPKIYLSPEETQEASDIVHRGDFVLIYPFGGYGARIASEKYISLIDRLIKKGLKVVVVGDSYIRPGPQDHINESFHYDHPDVINLVGRNSCRLTSYIALQAKVYIGSIGCYMHPATASQAKIFALTCYEIWENNDVYGSSILQNDSLWYLRRYTGLFKNFADLYCFYNEDNIDELWDYIVRRMTIKTSSHFLYWGDKNNKREIVSFP